MFNDQEAYDYMRKLVSAGKYNQAFQFCKSHNCNDEKLKVSMNCAKQILTIIIDHSHLQENFHWNMQVVGEPRSRNGTVYSKMNRLEKSQQIFDLKKLFKLR